jgi:hypothetical protein
VIQTSCCLGRLPLLSDRISLFGRQVWEELEQQIEQGVKDCIVRERKIREAVVPPTETSSTDIKNPTDVSSGSDMDEWEHLEKQEVNEGAR